MERVRSFRDVIQDDFYHDIFGELSAYIENNPSKLESRSHSVENPDEASLDYFEVKKINITEYCGSK